MFFVFAFVFLFVCFILPCLLFVCLFVFIFFWGGGVLYFADIILCYIKLNSCQCISMKLDVFRKVTLRTVVLYC